MDVIKVCELIASELFDIVNDEAKDKLHIYLERHKEVKNVEKLNNKIYDYVEKILDDYDKEKILDYIVKNSPLSEKTEAIFDKEKFIDGFYANNIGISKSEKIDMCLINALIVIENSLNLSSKERLFLKQIEELKESISQIENEKSLEQLQEEKLLHCIRQGIQYKNRKLCKKICKMYVDQKKDEYIDEISYLNFSIQTSWKERILNILEFDKNKKALNYYEKVNYIRENIEYDEIYEIVNNLYNGNDWEGQKETELKYILKKRKYNKVYVLVGNLGAGKTFFIKTFIQKAKQDTIILNISIYDLYEWDIENLLIKNFASYIGEKCCSLDEICKWGDKLNCKICILIENIQGLYEFSKLKFRQLIEEIQNLTKYDLFSWFITISEQEFYILKESGEFLERYCFGNRNGDDCFVQNAFNLNDYNDNYNIVNGIFKKYKLTLNDCKDDASRLIREPLYAHIIGSYFKGNKKIQFPETYFQLVVEINNIMDKRIENIDGEKIRELERKILEKLCNNKQLFIRADELSDFKIQISELLSIQLLTIVEEVDEDVFSLNHMGKSTKICLKTEIFWALKIVLFYMEKYTNNSLQIVTQLMNYDNTLQILMISIYVNRLMYLKKDIDSVFDLLFKRKKGAYILFGTRNYEEKYDKIIYLYLMNHKIKSDYQTTFALLYFIYYSRLSVDEKIHLVIKYSMHIDNMDLVDIYEHVVKHIANEIYNVKKLMECFLILAPCKSHNINKKNGYIFGKKYKELEDVMNISFDNSIKELACFIKKRKKEFSEINYKDRKYGVRNDSFIDYFVRAVFENYIRKLGLINVWERCDKSNIFSMKNMIGKMFRRNFTCGAGNLFNKLQSDDFKKQYEQLVYKLCENEQNKFTAMFLIINTLEEDRFKETWDDRFLELFLYLWEDINISVFFKRVKEVNWILNNCVD